LRSWPAFATRMSGCAPKLEVHCAAGRVRGPEAVLLKIRYRIALPNKINLSRYVI
jgi:hypothetical protein